MSRRREVEAKYKGCGKARLHGHVDGTTHGRRAERILDLAQRGKQHFLPILLRGPALYEQLAPVQVEVQTRHGRHIREGMQAEVRFITRTCPYSPQAQLQGSLQDAPGYFMKRLIDAGLRFVSFTLRKPHTTVALLSKHGGLSTLRKLNHGEGKEKSSESG